MAKKKADPSAFDDALDGITEDIPVEKPAKKEKATEPKPTEDATEEGYSYPGKAPRISRKKREDL